MALGYAQAPPCHAVSWISLFASPLNGVWLAGILRRVFLLPLWLLQTLHRHLHDLSTGEFVKDLMAEVRRCMYAPATEDDRNRRIPIRIIAATRDGAVDKRNREGALAEYTNPPPHQLDEDHTSIKLPTHTGDVRYRVLATDLQSALVGSFKRLCGVVTADETAEADRLVALQEMRRRYGKLIRQRMGALRLPRRMEDVAEDEFLLLIASFGSSRDLPAFVAVNMAMMVLEQRYRDWR
jgi:hypothetical protein